MHTHTSVTVVKRLTSNKVLYWSPIRTCNYMYSWNTYNIPHSSR